MTHADSVKMASEALENLRIKSVQAVKWSALGTLARYVLQFLAQTVLARLLGPENYGLFALGMLVMALSRYLSDLGFCWSLMQIPDLTESDIRFTCTWQLILGTATGIALFAGAPVIAHHFNQPNLIGIVRWLSFAAVLTAMTAPATCILSRNLDFRSTNLIQLAGYAVGYLAIGIPSALAGFGVWSLVAAWLSQALVTFILSVIRCRYPMTPLFWYSGAAALWRYGLTVFVTNLCNGLLTNLDRIFLGSAREARQVGIYSAAYNLADAPNMMLVSSLQPVFFAAGARIQSEPERLRRAYLSILETVWIVIAPLFIVLSLTAKEIVFVLYGTKWESSGMVLAILALGMPAYITCALSTPILWNTNGKHLENLLQWPILIVFALTLHFLGRHGAVTVAAVVVAMQGTRAAVIGTTACRRLHVSWRDIRTPALRATAMCMLTAIATGAGLALSRSLDLPHFFALLVAGLSGCSVLVLATKMFPALVGTAVTEMLARFPLPLPFRRTTG